MTREQLLEIMQQIMHDSDHPLLAASMGIIQEGNILFAETIGMCHLSPDVPATCTTKYRMASISKLMTATGIWQQVEQKRLDMHTDVSDYLGFRLRNPRFPDTPITLGMLLSHTSSVRESDDEHRCTYNLPATCAVSAFFDPQNSCYDPQCWGPDEPGTFYSYCNFNYGLLGTILESVTGERFDDYMNRHLFEPLSLDCGFYVPSMKQEAQRAIGTLYRKLNAQGESDAHNGIWTPQVDDYSQGFPTDAHAHYIPGRNATVFSPQGGLRASIRDLLTLMLSFMGKGPALLRPETIEDMFRPVWTYDEQLHNGDNPADQCYGRGPQIYLNRPGLDRLSNRFRLPFAGHGAGAYGLLGTLGMDLHRQNGLVVIAIGTGCASYPGVYSHNNHWEEQMIEAAAEFADFGYPSYDIS